MTIGKCLLTGSNGTFVKSHLTPQAFTAPAMPGAYFVTAGNRTRPTRTFTSWYDKSIVTRTGENILSDLDNYAISTLRRHKLVWSGWNGKVTLDPDLHVMWSPTHGIRSVEFEDVSKIRLFCLSLLWRWAVSKLPAAAEVNLSAEDKDKLREMIITGDAGNSDFFPIAFIQLSTQGEIHNMGPIFTSKKVLDLTTNTYKQVPFYRFYFDGLTIHFGMSADSKELGALTLGAESSHTFPTVTYEGSFQLENLNYVKQDALHEFPEIMQKLI